MLKNAYFLAKIGADTAKNEGNFAEIVPVGRRVAACGRRGLPHLRADFEHLRGADRHGGQHADLGRLVGLFASDPYTVRGAIISKWKRHAISYPLTYW